MILLHTAWGVITFAALDERKWFHLAFVWIAHITVSCLVSPCSPAAVYNRRC